MGQKGPPGQIVILNGTPRSGKSSIAAVIQNTFEGVWMNLGVDRFKEMTPERYQPGIGLRPGGERPDLGLGFEQTIPANEEDNLLRFKLDLRTATDPLLKRYRRIVERITSEQQK